MWSRDLIAYIVNIVLAVILIILSAPFFVLIFIVLLFENGGAVFFVQERIGFKGKPFKMYKFVTLVTEETGYVSDADLFEGKSSVFKRFLRKSRLDELPQFLNVITGDMNIVGPRPVTVEIYQDLKKELPKYDLRHSIKPGITGYAQVEMGYASTLSQEKLKFKYDLYYLDNKSLWFDFKIILKTIKVLFSLEGK